MPEQKVRDQAYIRQSNIHAVLSALREEQPISRRDIIRISGMSPTSITRIIGTLIDLSLVVEGETDAQSTGRGRKAIALRTNSDGLYTLGILLDRHMLTLCVLNFNSEVLYSAVGDMPDGHAPEDVARAAQAMFDRVPDGIIHDMTSLRGIGIGMSGTVNPGTGACSAFERVFGLPVWLENDVKAALIGEKERLAIPRRTDAAYLHLGRGGIGTSVTSGGELLRGECNAAGEVSHIALLPSELRCECGQRGCLQLHLAEDFLLRRAREAEPSIASLEALLAAQRQRLPWAEMLAADFKRHFRLMITLLDGFYNPAKIIVGGDTACGLRALLEDGGLPEHVVLADDFPGASVRGVAILAMRQALLRRLAEYGAV